VKDVFFSSVIEAIVTTVSGYSAAHDDLWKKVCTQEVIFLTTD
jgi:hypothetical protein